MKHAPRLSRTLLALLALAASLPAGDVEQEDDLEDSLLRCRQALRLEAWAEHSGGLVLAGKGVQSEVEGTQVLELHPDGRFRGSFDSALPNAFGFDGERAWETSWSGMPKTLDLEERERTLAFAWILLGRWLEPEGPFEVRATDLRSASGDLVLELGLRGGLWKATLSVDLDTWLPTRITRHSTLGNEHTELSDWSTGEGPRLPRSVSIIHEAGERIDWTFEAPRAPDDDAELGFAAPVAPEDFAIDPDARARVSMRETRTGHLLVKPRINGRSVGWFLFDTGAATFILDPGVAKKLRLPEVGAVVATGAGGSMRIVLRRADSFKLGPFRMENPVLGELDLAHLEPVMGYEVVGICGYDLLRRATVVLDAEAKAINIHAAGTFDAEDVRWEPLLYSGNHAAIRARFEGNREDVFIVDTGHPGAVTFHTPAVRRYDLLEDRETELVHIGGAGGSVEARRGRLAWFELAGHRFVAPLAEFALAEETALADEYSAGIVGAELLAPFRVIFDYPSKRLGFLPRE